ncbi:MAG: restriction endonuclease subunit S [Chitinophagales bacterium]|nr:restriction endonuclease subunit S [Chitinophagales bacterium]
MRQGWKEIELSYFVNDFIVPQRDKPKKFDGDIPWCRIEDFNGVYLSDSKSNQNVSEKTIREMGLKVFPINTVIVSCSADLGKCAIIQKPLVTNQTFIGLVPSENLDSKFLYFYMMSIAKKLNEMASGATIKYLSKKKFRELVVCFPPLPEQQRIVSILDQAFAAIDQAKALAEKSLQTARELFESYLQGVFEKKGEGWEEKKLGEVASTNGRIGWKGLTAKEYTSQGPLFLSVHSLNYGDYVDFRDAFHISQERYMESPEIMLKKDDILICKDGAGIGKLGIVPDLPGLVTINSSLLLIRCKSQLRTKFLYYNLLSPNFQRIVYSRLSGATTPHLYQRDIVTFPISVPPIMEQDNIVRKLDFLRIETQKLEAVYKKKIDDLEELRKSLLQKAFSGELKTESISVPVS